jgi:tetratricopeptide (TPR) repeat protein
MDDEIERELRALCGDDDDLFRALSDPLLWEVLFAEPPQFEVTRSIELLQARLEAEEDAAAVLCASLLTGPSLRWPERVRATPGTRTAGMVKQILRRADALVERRPADALQASSMALAITDVLDPQDYPLDLVMRLRANALRDHACVLTFLNRDTEAMQYVERAERTLAQISVVTYDEACLWLVKTPLLRMQKRYEEAIALAGQAARTFLEFCDRLRYLKARIIEAEVLYDSGVVEPALEIFTSVKDDPELDAPDQLRITHHIAACLSALGRDGEAVDKATSVGTG